MSSVVTNRFIHCHNALIKERKVRSSRQFALSLDYLPQSLSEILKGRRDVTIEVLRKAVALYSINPNYIFGGSGAMFTYEEVNQQKEGGQIVTIVTDSNDEERIVYVPVSAQAGYGGQLHDPIYFKELPTFCLPDFRFKSGTHRCFDISGDSMEPTLYTGDKVVCSFLEKENWEVSVKDNFVYVIVTKGDVLVKRIGNKIKESGVVELFSDNSFYKPYPVNITDVLEIWFVKVKISPFMPSPTNMRNALHEEVDNMNSTIADQSVLIKNLNGTIEKLLKQNRARI